MRSMLHRQEVEQARVFVTKVAKDGLVPEQITSFDGSRFPLSVNLQIDRVGDLGGCIETDKQMHGSYGRPGNILLSTVRNCYTHLDHDSSHEPLPCHFRMSNFHYYSIP
jgi:hypothetical protein